MRTLHLLPLALLCTAGCLDCESAPPPPQPCLAGDGARAALSPAPGVQVFLDDESQAGDLLAEEVSAYLERLWGEAVPITRGAPGDDVELALFLTAQGDAAVPDGGYVLRRSSEGGRTRVVVAAKSSLSLAHGAFALLERLGARFFHPRDELVPALGGPHLPPALDEVAQPAFPLRGTHLHLLHPLEYLPAILEPGEENLAEAKRFIDWLVKTGQNHLQWYMMETVPWEPWVPHAEEILAYAHERGLTVGLVVHHVDGASATQNQLSLASDHTDMDQQVEESLDEIMVLPFDHIEVALGEFFAGDPAVLVESLDHATAYMAERYPATTFGIENHVGDYPELYVDYEGDTHYFYFLPGLADERLINNVHTVFFFDLYRDWGMYAHEDFSGHRDFLLDQLQVRPVRYFPESSYWVSADMDVPVFLAEYIHARWVDITGLARDIKERGLPNLDGHVLYSSGHEWGYWMVDYLTARMLWHAEAPLEEHLAHVTSPFGACADDVNEGLSSFVSLQTRFLFDERLVPYASTEDLHDDLGYAAGIDTHPPRVPFESLRGLSLAETKAFEENVLDRVEEAARRIRAEALAPLQLRCPGADGDLAPFCDELVDGVEVTALRLEHSAHLYRAVLKATARDEAFEEELAAAVDVREQAAAVIARRASGYRFPFEELAEAFPSPTRYKFGMLRQAHNQCLWIRQELQVEHLLDSGEAASPFELPTCQD